ncbi:MAG TPA: tRNA (adenosine(37)-N6)-threonylcarbamoyltransferase complex ATPase subunit type 1 TsaE [Thermoanaerobaculia bacterium]|nr:tRNA (adenosine(37)-N6)-threonylcarbamoyltransferase complex ATPase subunit type 1 TsaE [Thermoanaerobaculia bacterium]
MPTVRTTSAAETRQVAAALEPLLGAGDLLVLSGDLGAGKTAFVQGLAAALGVTGRVTSPTFTLAHTYQGRLRLHHLDVYRFADPSEVLDLDLPELLADDAVTAVEWGETVLSELPGDFLRLEIRFGGPEESPDVRWLDFEPQGAGWRARAAALEAALEGGALPAPRRGAAAGSETG